MTSSSIGISVDDINILVDNRDFILNNLSANPLKLAFSGVSPLICTQIKYLNKCKYKLPHLYQVGAIIPPLSYQQSSSNLSVLSRNYSGNRCLDLTCGLGVDSYNFSKTFKEVVSIELLPELYEVAKHNFALLKCDNIKLINCDSVDYVKSYCGEMFDMVFIDPARRNKDNKVFSFEQSSPNVLELLSNLKKIARRVVIKSSPMFDNNEAFTLFGDSVSLKTVSVSSECKELIIDICDDNIKEDIVTVINSDAKIKNYQFNNYPPLSVFARDINSIEARFVLIPDVGFIKNRRVTDLFYRIVPQSESFISNGSLGVSTVLIDEFAVRCFEIADIFEYKPKAILAYLKEKKIKSATIIIKNFPYDISSIKKTLKLNEGSDAVIIATTIGGIDAIFFVRTCRIL